MSAKLPPLWACPYPPASVLCIGIAIRGALHGNILAGCGFAIAAAAFMVAYIEDLIARDLVKTCEGWRDLYRDAEARAK
jgi:hypothetical protein